MKGSLIASSTVQINAEPARVWKALTTPSLVSKYLMGTKVSTDWREGSEITYSGNYNGKDYTDKGVIKKVEPNRILQSTYLSSMSGKKDEPDNYNVVTYALTPENGKTVLTLTQDNIATEEERDHSTKNWNMVLNKLKDVVEHEPA